MTRRPCSRPARPAVLLAALLLPAAGLRAQVAISEFLASNSRGLVDSDGVTSDWIELRNTGDAAVNLLGWSLTDDPAQPRKWVFPETNLPPNTSWVIFASGKDRAVPGGPLHTSFSLSADGEYLALFPPEGEAAASEFAPAYPRQRADISYGFRDGQPYFFNPPSPGQPNSGGVADFVGDTRFSRDRGFYDAPFDLVLNCATPGAAIRYTTNGAPPTLTTGLPYTAPVRIDRSVVIRAAAFRDGLQPSNVDTHTYLFPADVIRQSPNGERPWAEWPAPATSGRVYNYGMDPDIVNSPRWRDEVIPALRALPTLSVVTALPNLFSSSGIYQNPSGDGRAWERPCSIELIWPDGTAGFQVDCGIRIRGGFSRSADNPKHAFRFLFREQYGASKLRYPLHPGGTDAFDNLDFRTFQNYSWSFQGDSRGVFIRDQFSRDAQLAMGHNAERGRYVHLYLNGIYWGIYNSCERAEASYGETYFGGQKTDYDVVKIEAGPYALEATDGNLQAWTRLYNTCRAGITNNEVYFRLQGRNADGSPNPQLENLLEVDNLIDYLLVIFFGGNLDAPISNFLGNTRPNNWYGMRNRTGQSGGFRFFSHDAEHTLLNAGEDRTGPYAAGSTSVTYSNPQYLFQQLAANPEFRLRIGDRAYRHFFNGGPLSTDGARALFGRRTNELYSAVVAESARWGDSKVATPFNRDDHWRAEAGRIMGSYFSSRPAAVLAQLRAKGWYPAVEPPALNRFGGNIEPGFAVTLAAPAGTRIVYTLNGTDPRDIGGGESRVARLYTGPITLNESSTLLARARSGDQWSALAEASFTVVRTFREFVVTEILYQPAPRPGVDVDELDFIELQNTGPVELDVGGVAFTNGISFRFPRGTRVAPGERVVLAENPAALAQAHPGLRVFGRYAGQLANGGERLTLVHAAGGVIQDFAYGVNPPWPAGANGLGFSLVATQPGPAQDPAQPASWRAGSRLGGTPGTGEVLPDLAPVQVHEILAHTDPPQQDAVELFNPAAVEAPVGGWFLTDDPGLPAKYRIPPGTVIPPGGWLVIEESQFNAPAQGDRAFRLGSLGDEVYLFSAAADGSLTGYSDGFAFGATPNGVSLGRYTNSVGELRLVPQARPSLGAANSGPALPPVVLNEIFYFPGPAAAALVEIRNTTRLPVPLFDPAFPTNTWRLDGLDFQFPAGIVLPPEGYAVVTEGNADLVRLLYAIPPGVPVFGPTPGLLQRDGERLELRRPDSPGWVTNNGVASVRVPWLEVDTVRYQDRAPWPAATSGQTSLERLPGGTYGDDPASWRASRGLPSPGTDNNGNRPPQVEAGPEAQLAATTFPVVVPAVGSATDDGLPLVPGALAYAWSQVGGPPGVVFSQPGAAATDILLPGQGTFRVRLTVSDGERATADDRLLTVGRPAGDQTLVALGSTWRYFDQGVDQGTAWRERAFNDAAWPAGRARLGYGGDGEVTVINGGPGTSRIPTAYFRLRFNVAQPASVTSLRLRVVRDDGVIVYLNGREVLRDSMPEAAVTFSTLATATIGGADETTPIERLVDPTLLVAGENVLAAEVHQVNATSSDLGFDLALIGAVQDGNTGPSAEAGPVLSVTLPQPATLRGSFADDGLPFPPGVPTFSWTAVSGPGEVAFATPGLPVTQATFSAPGTYVLRFSVADGALTASDTTTVTVAGTVVADLGLVALPGNPVRLRFRAAEGRAYTLRHRPQLEAGSWQTLQEVPAGAARDVEFADPAGEDSRFYQVISGAP